MVQVSHFRRSRLTLEYKNCLNVEKKKRPFNVLIFHPALQFGCVHIFNCGLKRCTY